MATPRVVNFRLSDEALDQLDAIAKRNGLERSEVIRRFIAAGLEVNPTSETEIREVRKLRAQRAAGSAPSLVIPGSPFASSDPEKKSGGEGQVLRLKTPPRRPSSDDVTGRPSKFQADRQTEPASQSRHNATLRPAA